MPEDTELLFVVRRESQISDFSEAMMVHLGRTSSRDRSMQCAYDERI
jgi:hypothetical protein